MEAGARSQRPGVVVVGAGIIGLTAALELARDGYAVTMIARELPGSFSTRWASPWAGALLAPHPDYSSPELQRTSLEAYQRLHDQDISSGVKRIKITEFYDDRPDEASIWYKDFVSSFQQIPKNELENGTKIGFSYNGFIVNPNQILPWLVTKLKAHGVSFINAEVSSLDEARRKTGAAIVVNASGLGAKELAGDDKVYASRGQTMLVQPRNFDEVVIRQGSEYTYAIPRPSDGHVVLGGFTHLDDERETPDVSLRQDIMGRVNKLIKGKFDWVDVDRDVQKDIVGFRPCRKGGIRLEREGSTIHAYGLGSLGYLYAFGVADRVRSLCGDVGKEVSSKL